MKSEVFEIPNVAPIPRTALSMAETALSIGVCERTVQDLVSNGILPVVRVGKRCLIPVQLLLVWLTEQATTKA